MASPSPQAAWGLQPLAASSSLQQASGHSRSAGRGAARVRSTALDLLTVTCSGRSKTQTIKCDATYVIDDPGTQYEPQALLHSFIGEYGWKESEKHPINRPQLLTNKQLPPSFHHPSHQGQRYPTNRTNPRLGGRPIYLDKLIIRITKQSTLQCPTDNCDGFHQSYGVDAQHLPQPPIYIM